VRAVQAQRRILATVTVLHGAIGTAVATAVPGPLLAVDDLAYLSMGRTLAGGGAAPLGPQPPYGFLYPLLLAPGWALGLDESQMIIWARVVNSVLGALLIPVLYLLVRRMTDAPFVRSLLAAVIGASLPAALLTGSIVWTERLLPLLVAVAFLLLLVLHDDPSRRVAFGAVASAVALFAAHPRMGPTALVVVAAVVVVCVQRRGRRSGILAGFAGVLGIVSVELVRRAIATATFADRGTYDGFDLASRRGASEIPEMIVHGLGTVAYLVLATAGLAVIGVVSVMRSGRTWARWYIVMTAAVVSVAGWFLTGVDRSDAYLHGRYIEVMAPLLVSLGLLELRRMERRPLIRVVAGSIVAAGVYGAWAGPGDVWTRPRSPVMMLGTEVGGAPFGGDFFEPGAAASVALIVGLGLVVIARRRIWLTGMLAGAALTVAIFSGIEALDQLHEGSLVGQVQAALDGVEIERLVIDIDRVPSNLAGAVAWGAGLDRTAAEIGDDTTHLLLAADAPGPAGASVVVELPGASLWALP
jgi:hypothetical protein